MKVNVEVKLAWWLNLYLKGVVFFAQTTGLQPDEAKVKWWINKGIRIRIKPAKAE